MIDRDAIGDRDVDPADALGGQLTTTFQRSPGA